MTGKVAPENYSHLSILLVDDHAVVRQGIRQILALEFPAAAFGEARDAEEALGMLSKPWSLMVVDVGLPGRNGLELLSDARKIQPSLLVLVLSMFPERQYAVRALRGGACGYLTKDTALDELVKAARKALAGGKYISSELAEQLAREIASPVRKPHELLSTREHAVFYDLVTGKTPSDIAEKMAISVKTVCTYKRRAMEKLQVATDVDMVRYAIENQLI